MNSLLTSYVLLVTSSEPRIDKSLNTQSKNIRVAKYHHHIIALRGAGVNYKYSYKQQFCIKSRCGYLL